MTQLRVSVVMPEMPVASNPAAWNAASANCASAARCAVRARGVQTELANAGSAVRVRTRNLPGTHLPGTHLPGTHLPGATRSGPDSNHAERGPRAVHRVNLA